jgi:hypothetical protein
MDRQHSPPDRPGFKAAIAARLRLVRTEVYGESGGPRLAAQMGLPSRTWINYESGVTIPGYDMLRFLELTGTSPTWLLHGAGAEPLAVTPASPAGEDL